MCHAPASSCITLTGIACAIPSAKLKKSASKMNKQIKLMFFIINSFYMKE
jgi:hypothetical protein